MEIEKEILPSIIHTLENDYHVHHNEGLIDNASCVRGDKNLFSRQLNDCLFISVNNSYMPTSFSYSMMEKQENKIDTFFNIFEKFFRKNKTEAKKDDVYSFFVDYSSQNENSKRKIYNDLLLVNSLIDNISDDLNGKINAFIQTLIKSYKKWFNQAAIIILNLLGKVFRSNNGISKDVEGFIAYVTWPRPPSIFQFVNKVIPVDKLSQINLDFRKIKYGY